MNWKHVRPPREECGGNTEHISFQKSHISRFITAVSSHPQQAALIYTHEEIWQIMKTQHGKMSRLKEVFIHKWKFTPMMMAITKTFWNNIIFSVRSLLTLMMFLFFVFLTFFYDILPNPSHKDHFALEFCCKLN